MKDVKKLFNCYSRDFYLTSAGWVGDSNQQVGAVWMNRAQNLSIVSACVSPNWTCIEVSEKICFVFNKNK